MITGSFGSSYFEYDDGHQRVWQHATGSSGTVDTTYIGGFYEKVDDANTTKHKCYIASPTGRIAIYTQTYDKHTFGTTYDTKYCHRDHLGSVDVITDSTGTVLERDSFDAWGFRRTTDWQAQRPIGSTSIVSRGFTDHEELDSLGLVNMNGRIYDPGIGRFMSGDPTLQFPDATQSFNRYSYVLNNPLSFTDPSGFSLLSDILTGFGARLIGMLPASIRPIVIGVIAVAIAVSMQFYIMPAILAPWAATLGASAAFVISAAGAGFTSAFTSTILSGGSLGQAFQSGVLSAGVAALMAGVIGPRIEGIGNTKTFWGIAEKSLGHGIVGGMINAAENKLQNGSFRDGFLSGFASGAASVGINMIPGSSPIAVGERVMLSAAVGGTAAELGGGKFANGAITAAFLRLYNEDGVAERMKQEYQAESIDREVHGWFNKEEGWVWIANYRTGESMFLDGFSGGTYGSTTYNSAMSGTYSIVDEPTGDHRNWFGLFLHDGVEINDQTRLADGTLQSGVRFHMGTISFGCVTITCNANEWGAVQNIVYSASDTRTLYFRYGGGSDVYHVRSYGVLTVY